jgi:hypothetical protein
MEVLEYEVPPKKPAVPVGKIGGIVIEVVLSEKPRRLGAKRLVVGPAFKMTEEQASHHDITPDMLRLLVLDSEQRVKQEVFDAFLPGVERDEYFHLFSTNDKFVAKESEGVHLSFELIEKNCP